jgi:CRISPR/Cas system-associated exonuclease Cas4 (RecB family)
MKSFIIPYNNDLIEEVFSHLIPQGKDYCRNIVVFPGRRPAHFLRKKIAENVQSATIPPAIYSMDEFIGFLYTEVTRILEPIDAVAILYKINEGFKSPFGKTAMSPDEFFPLGLRIFNDLEELYIECVPPLKIKEIGYISGEAIPHQTLINLQTLFNFYTEFYKICKDKGYSTRSIQYRAVAERLTDNPINGSIILAGFFALTASEKMIFKSLSYNEDAVLLFQQGTGIAEKIKELGLTIDETIDDNQSTDIIAPDYIFYKSPDTHGQIFALSSLLNEQSLAPDIDTVIVLPSSDTLFALYNHALSPLGESNYNISMGYPLFRTPIYSFINSLTDVIISINDGRVYIPDYLKFVLHPYTKNIHYKGRADITRIIFHKIADWFTHNRARMFVSLEDIETDETLNKEIEIYIRFDSDITISEITAHLKNIHDQTIRKFMTFTNTADFATKTIEILTYIYDHSTASVHPFFYPFSESFINSLNIISNSLLGDVSFHHTSGYFNLFRKFINSRRIPFDGTPLQGIQALGVLETRNLKFKHVCVLDMNEGVIPYSVDNSLIPLKVKKALNLATFKDNESLTAYYLENLFKGAQKVYLFYVESAKKEPSRFIERLLWERQKEQGRLEIPEYIRSIQYKIELTTALPKDIFKSKEVIDFLMSFSFSPTALDTYHRCGIKFYYQYVLGLRERDEVSGKIEKMDIGIVVHDALKEYFTPFVIDRGKKLIREELDLNRVDTIIEEIFNSLYGSNISGAVYLLKRQIIFQFRRFIEFYQIPKVADSHYIIGLEKEYKTIWNGFRLNGKIDRIDRCNGRINIIDYKTGARKDYLNIRFKGLESLIGKEIAPSDRETINNAIGSIQLLFYNILYSNTENVNVDNIDSMFLLLGKSGINYDSETIELRLFSNSGERDYYYKTLSNIMLYLLKEIIDSNIPFTAQVGACSNCSYTSICGV